MTVLGLDLSTKTGYAVINDDGSLVEFGLIRPKIVGEGLYEYVDKSLDIARQVQEIVSAFQPDVVIIEQTNQGRFRSQKLLEFIHMAVLIKLRDLGYQNRIKYLDTSQWGRLIAMRMSKDQKKHNQRVKQHLARGKITRKHLSVRWVNEKFNQKFKLKDNDICDAICLCMAFLMLAPSDNSEVDVGELINGWSEKK